MPSSGGAKRPLMHLDGYMRSGGHTEWCRLSAGPCRCYDPEPDRLQGQQDVPCGRRESHDEHIHRYPEDPTPYYCDGTWRKLVVAVQFQELFRCMKTCFVCDRIRALRERGVDFASDDETPPPSPE